MLKNILNQNGVKSLNNNEKKSINGGFGFGDGPIGACRLDNGFIDFIPCDQLCPDGSAPEFC